MAMRAAFTSPPGMHTLVPRIAVSAAAAAILLHRKRRKEAGSRAGSDFRESQVLNATKVTSIIAKVPKGSTAAAAHWAGLLLPNILAVSSVLAWLAMLLVPIRSWMISVMPHMQLADAKTTKPAVELETVHDFCGSWVKDMQSSDSMDGFCQLFGVPRWLRQATRLITGLDITTSSGMLLVKQVCKIRWLSTTEAFPLDGIHTSEQKRRDMRSGKQTGQLLSASGQRMQLHVEWQGSLPGEATDTLQLQPSNKLVVIHEASVVNKGSATFKEVYIRQK